MKKLGFTLAEVLITLVIIGVIAAMTVPTLMNNTNAHEFRSALKKAISGVNQALTLHYALTSESAHDYSTASTLVDGIFKKRMSVMDAGLTGFTSKSTTCAADSPLFVTADGIVFCVDKTNFTIDTSSDTGACDVYNTKPCTPSAEGKVNMWIDVNGAKKPNEPTEDAVRPKDIYQATIYSQRVVPYGNPTQQVMYDAGAN